MDDNKAKGKKGIESYVGRAFMACVFLIMLINILWPEKEMSEEENRMLQGRPKLSWEGLVSGSYMESYENYLSDQFAGRSLLRKIKVAIKRFGGSKKENGVFVGSNGQLLEDIVVPDQKALGENLSAIRAFTEYYPDIPANMILVPDAANILKDNLPRLAEVADQNALISMVRKSLASSVQWIDAVKAMDLHKDEKIYYKTDHHWTTTGAFYVFQEAALGLGIKEDVSSMYVSYPVTTNFNGSLAAASGCRLDENERIDIYVPKDTDNDVMVNYVDDQLKATSLYQSDKLKTRDKYALFLGGNSSVVHIKTMAERKNRLLLIKDSYANCFVPFLAPFYREIIVVDPRYYAGTAQDIMNTYKITDMMFLYSGNTFFRDNHLSGVLKIEQSNRTGISAKDRSDTAE